MMVIEALVGAGVLAKCRSTGIHTRVECYKRCVIHNGRGDMGVDSATCVTAGDGDAGAGGG
jgi:hypothetical protein